jgi:hypothetical protein
MRTDTMEIATRDGGTTSLSSAQIRDLRGSLEGSLLREGDAGWDEAILIWNAMVAKKPALVIQPASSRDVVRAVDFARDHGLLISVKGGGHHIAGTSIAEGGLTLDMSRMREVTVDPGARLAHVEPGCLLGDVDRATQEHGLATVLGFVSETGVAGLTLGGGLGYLARRFGWTADNLEEVEIVTADGQVRTASRREDPDLFWALRGGGGNFGVVTRFTYRLHEVGPTVYGGLIAWPFDRAGEVLPSYRAITGEAPRELSMWLILMRAPPMPFVPAEWHGERICAMAVCYTGDLSHADEVIAPVRALGDPVVDLLQEMPYVEVQSYLDESEPKGMHYYWKTEYVAELSDDLLTTTRELFAECPVPGAELAYLHLGGRSTSTLRTTARSAIGMPATPWGSLECGSRTIPTRPCTGSGSGMHGREFGRSPPAATTSTSRRPTRARSASGRCTGPTSAGWPRSRGSTTRKTSSA